jgi:hypothetical protein
MLPEQLPQISVPVLKRLPQLRRVEHQEGDFAPGIRLVLPPHDAHCLLKRLAIQPQFAVQR